MSKLWSEENKPINVLKPAEQTDADHTTDVVNLASFKRCTFLVITGATSVNAPQITVLAGLTKDSCTTAIVFNYRTQIAAAPDAAGSDVMSALTKLSATTGFTVTASKVGGMYIIEVDVREVAEGGAQFDHVALKLDKVTGHAVHIYGVLAILSQPRYETLKTAIA